MSNTCAPSVPYRSCCVSYWYQFCYILGLLVVVSSRRSSKTSWHGNITFSSSLNFKLWWAFWSRVRLIWWVKWPSFWCLKSCLPLCIAMHTLQQCLVSRLIHLRTMRWVWRVGEIPVTLAKPATCLQIIRNLNCSVRLPLAIHAYYT